MTRDTRGSTDAPHHHTTAADDAARPGDAQERTDRGIPSSVPDPEALRERGSVDFGERTARVPPEEFEKHDQWAGIAVLAVTDGDGRVVLSWSDEDHGLLPHAPVEPDEDFAAVARQVATERLSLEVELEGVERVRRTEYRPAADEDRRTVTHDVLFRASPVGPTPDDEALTVDRGCWTAAWADRVPPNPDWDRPAVREDVRRFVD